MKTFLPPVKHNILNRQRITSNTILAKKSGTGTVTTDTTAPLWPGQASHVRMAGYGIQNETAFMTLSTPWDLTNSYLRFASRITLNSAAAVMRVYLAASAAAFTAGNYLTYFIRTNPTGGTMANWYPPNTWVWDGMAPSIMNVTGTGAPLNSIGYIAFLAIDKSGTTATTWDIAEVQNVQLVGTKAKIVIWHDDTVTAGVIAIHDKLKAYGFPGQEATEWETLSTTSADYPYAAYKADGWEFGTHAITNPEHTDVADAAFINQIGRAKIADTKYGNNGRAADLAYWGGLRSEMALPYIRLYYRSARWNTSGLQCPDTQPPPEPGLMKAYLAAVGETFATNWKPYVDNTITSKGIAQFVFHQDIVPPASGSSQSAYATEFDNMLAYLDQNRASIDVVTINTALAASTA